MHAPVRDEVKKQERAGAYSVNIGAQDARAQRDGTYKKENMTAEEVSLQAEQMDMDVQKLYMAVMSNSMSQDEFHEMLEEGVHVTDVDIETVVTILDRIRVAVAKGGGDITGFTDDLSKETLEQILGSSAYAEALRGGLEEGSIAYMVDQQMEPTAENLYRAKYSAGAGQKSPEADVPDLEEDGGKAFWEQIDKIIKEAGLAQGEESRESAAFLLRHDIPVTKENLRLYEKLKNFEKGSQEISEEELKYRIAMQVYEGTEAVQADLSGKESIYEQAQEIFDAVQGLSPEAAEHAYENRTEGEEITLKDLMASQEKVQAGSEGEASKEPEYGNLPEETDRSMEFLTARRRLEEVRLRMTVEANVKLLRSGFQIDTAPMEKLIERLRAMEETLAGEGVSQTARVAETINELRSMPAYTLGYVVNREISFTIEALHEKGSELQGEFEKADREKGKLDEAKARYETMQTAPRADMGDSIRKAFRNVDDILTDMNRESSEENRRAVRILGYNRLEITEENLERALEVDKKVQDLFQNMKPGKVLQMIREGVDVLHTDIEELDAYLAQQSGTFVEESEEFARFLHKLDKNGGITPEERESYIGIYRLIRQVEKSDGKAEGYLLGSGAELTMENLLTGVRSGKKGYMDYKIDESFSGVDALRQGKDIIDQINAAPYESAGEYEAAMRTLEGAKRGRSHGEKDAVEFLKETNQPVTISNLLEASSVLQEDAGIYQKIEDYEKKIKREERLEEEQSRLEGYVMDLHESAGDEESLREGMEAFARQAETILREAEGQEGITELDIRDMQQIYKGIRFRTELSKESHYQIPVKSETGYTIMNLTVKRGTGRAQAEISVKTERYGRLEALFTKSNEAREGGSSIHMAGNLFAETESGAGLLKSVAASIQERMQDAGISVEEMRIVQGGRLKGGISGMPDGAAGKGDEGAGKAGDVSGTMQAKEEKEISTGELYQIAKIFLESVRN